LLAFSFLPILICLEKNPKLGIQMNLELRRKDLGKKAKVKLNRNLFRKPNGLKQASLPPPVA
jgi:hypothetical protein